MAIIKNPLTVVQGGSSPLANYGSIVYTNNGVDTTLTLATEADFLALSYGGAGARIVINGVTVNKNDIKAVAVADGVDYLPNSFCYACNFLQTATIPSSVKHIGNSVFSFCNISSAIDLSNVSIIGDSFLQNNSSFNYPISLPKLIYVGNSFLQNCTSFNSSITLSDNTTFIGPYFLSGCASFSQPLTIPSGLMATDAISTNPGQRFLYGCNNFVGPLVCNGPVTQESPIDNYSLATTSSSADMYTTGVTLTGAYAQEWKNRLPDRSSGTYRKLIIGS